MMMLDDGAGRGEGADGAGAGDSPEVVALVRDLMMGSRIMSAGRSTGVAVRMVREASRLASVGGRRLIVDLNEPGAIAAAVEWKQRTGGAVIGFVSHVDRETMASARSAGVDTVVPRSRFVEMVGEVVGGRRGEGDGGGRQ